MRWEDTNKRMGGGGGGGERGGMSVFYSIFYIYLNIHISDFLFSSFVVKSFHLPSF